MCITYFARDHRNFDYEPWTLSDFGWRPFRGPDPTEDIANSDGGYVVFLGGAQTFGRFSRESFVSKYSDLAGLPCVNLGHGGLSPELILNFIGQSKKYTEIIQNASHVVIQITSPKNTGFDNTKVVKHPDDMWSYPDDEDNKLFWSYFLRDYYLTRGKEALVSLIEDMQNNYVSKLIDVCDFINPPKTLLYLNMNVDLTNGREDSLIDSSSSGADVSYADFIQASRYPQLISQRVIDSISSGVDAPIINYDYSDNGSIINYKISKEVESAREEVVKNKIFLNPTLESQFNRIKNKQGLIPVDQINDYNPSDSDHTAIAQLLYDNIPQT